MGKYLAEKNVQIFLSYAYEDKKEVDFIVTIFSEYGIPLRYDENLEHHSNFLEFMESAQNCDFMIPVISIHI
ncbi:hypothetical protein Nit79A3_2007 [Nitrosomonas sp. Is79A3]